MAKRYFPTWVTAQVLAALNSALADQATGQTIISASSGDVSASGVLEFGLDERIRRLKHDLSILDPVTYPPSDFMDFSTTRVGFS